MNYLSTAEQTIKWGISQRRVAILCKEGRISGAMLKGNMWIIPEEAIKPIDPRKEKKSQINTYI